MRRESRLGEAAGSAKRDGGDPCFLPSVSSARADQGSQLLVGQTQLEVAAVRAAAARALACNSRAQERTEIGGFRDLCCSPPCRGPHHGWLVVNGRREQASVVGLRADGGGCSGGDSLGTSIHSGVARREREGR